MREDHTGDDPPHEGKRGKIDECLIKLDANGRPYIPFPEHPELRLTPWKEDDIDDLVELFNQPNIAKWGHSRPFPYLKEHVLDSLPNLGRNDIQYLTILINSLPISPNLSIYPKTKLSPISAVRNKDEKIIGTLSVRPSSNFKGDFEISYNLHDQLTGKGIGKEMVKIGIKLAKWLGIKRLLAFTEIDNHSSKAILRNAGFTLHAERLVDWPEHRGGGKRSAYIWEIYPQSS
ncbi:uncharacterized protein I206_101282 [Kwoniella pini CBS 10737]|uniref:N-acetyltransferase domain-containing protein n=1 Tax=Kwoniella pini CBS 10737 TaxID=1296096 RepID=A0A1B9IAU6_9TREE|nr:uncharacterized protein I206_00041 [Kwoniella pini CBS 10737]OCF52745.1 hypothetical protein I206_00041 [Kwoniella pini CBS 10737]